MDFSDAFGSRVLSFIQDATREVSTRPIAVNKSTKSYATKTFSFFSFGFLLWNNWLLPFWDLIRSVAYDARLLPFWDLIKSVAYDAKVSRWSHSNVKSRMTNIIMKEIIPSGVGMTAGANNETNRAVRRERAT